MQSHGVTLAFHGEPQDTARQLVRLHRGIADRHASSKAVSKSMSVGGSKELLWNPRMARPQSFHTDTDIFG